jgi:serine/threonine protein kinase
MIKFKLCFDKKVQSVTCAASTTMEAFRILVKTHTGIPPSRQVLEVDIDGDILPMKFANLQENGVKTNSLVHVSLSAGKELKILDPGPIEDSTPEKLPENIVEVPNIKEKPFESWTCDEVCAWLAEKKISPENVAICRHQQLTGISLMDITIDELKDMDMKYGPAKAIVTYVARLLQSGGTTVTEQPIVTRKPQTQVNPVEKVEKVENKQGMDSPKLQKREQNQIQFSSIELGKKIAQGGEGTIYMGKYNGKTYAIKQMITAKSRELQMILLIDDPGLMKCHYWCEDKAWSYYLMDLMDTSLHDCIYEDSIILTNLEKLRIIQAIIRGCKKLHSLRIIHKDLKPQNILLKKTNGIIDCKIADFGISKEKKTDSALSVTLGITGTLRYLPYEYFLNHTYGQATDVYAFGIILWSEVPDTDVVHKIINKDVFTTEECPPQWKEVEEIMKQCCGEHENRDSFDVLEKKFEKLAPILEKWFLNKVEYIKEEIDDEPKGLLGRIGDFFMLPKGPKKKQVVMRQVIVEPKPPVIWTLDMITKDFKVQDWMLKTVKRVVENDSALKSLVLTGMNPFRLIS